MHHNAYVISEEVDVATPERREQARLALDQQLAVAKQLAPALTVPRGGWLRVIRDALGVSSAVLARRLRLNQSTVIRLEQNEGGGIIQLDTLRRAADALGCDLVYALIPRRPLEHTFHARALEIASAELHAVEHTMALEDQGTGVIQEAIERLAEELTRGGQVTWDE
jgi:predicted DNA-binding mobile mystery protein A